MAKPTKQPDAYLVVMRCTIDDIPIRLCSSEAEAKERARRLTPRSGRRSALGIDRSTPLNASVYRFRNGVFVDWYSVKDFA